MTSHSDVPPPNASDLVAHVGFVRSLARDLTGDTDAAEDVAQQTMLAALSHQGGPIHSVRGWLGGIARKLTLMHRRREGRRHRHEGRYRDRAIDAVDAGDGDPVTHALQRVEQRQVLIDAVLALPRSYRDALVLRYMEGLSPRDIAATLDLPLNTVRSHLSRGLAKLREELDERHGGDRRAWQIAVAGLLVPGTGLKAAPRVPWKPLTTAAGVAALCVASGVLLFGGDGQSLRDDRKDPAAALAGSPEGASTTSTSQVATSPFLPGVPPRAPRLRLIDQRTDAPIPGAEVRIFRAPHPRDATGFSTVRIVDHIEPPKTTDRRGTIDLSDAPEGDLIVIARADGYAPVRAHRVARGPRDSGDVTIRMTPLTTLRLVRGTTDSRATLRIDVHPVGLARTPSPERFHDLGPGVDSLDVQGCTPGAYDIRVTCSDDPTRNVLRRVHAGRGPHRLYDDSLVPVRVMRPDASDLRVWITPRDRWMRPHELRARSGASEPASLGLVAPGEYDVHRSNDRGLAPFRITVPRTATDVTVALPTHDCVVSLEVLTPDVSLAITPAGCDQPRRPTRRGADIEFTHLDGREHILHAIVDETWLRRPVAPRQAGAEDTTIDLSRAGLLDVELTMVDPGGNLVDAVIDLEDEDGVRASIVRLIDPSRSRTRRRTAGHTHHWRVSPGRYTVLGRRPGDARMRRLRTIDVIESTSVRVTVDEPVETTITIKDANGDALANYPVTISDGRGRPFVTDADGAVRVLLHRNRPYVVRFLDGRAANCILGATGRELHLTVPAR